MFRDRLHKSFRQFDVSFQIHVGDFGLDHPEFGQVTAGVGIFRPERGAEAIGSAKGRTGGFHVKLPALGKVCGLVKIRRGKKCARTFAFVGGKNRRIDKGEIPRIEVFPNRLCNVVANGQDGVLAGTPDPQVPPVHQKIRAVFLGGNRIVFGLGNEFDVGSDDFKAAGSLGRFDDFAVNPDGAFLGQMLDGFKIVGGNVGDSRNDLDESCTVAKLNKADLAGCAYPHRPAGKNDAFSNKIFQMPDICLLKHG